MHRYKHRFAARFRKGSQDFRKEKQTDIRRPQTRRGVGYAPRREKTGKHLAGRKGRKTLFTKGPTGEEGLGRPKRLRLLPAKLKQRKKGRSRLAKKTMGAKKKNENT